MAEQITHTADPAAPYPGAPFPNAAHPPAADPLPPPDPVPLRHRADGWTPQVQRDFLAHLAASASVTHACAAVGRTRAGAYALRARADARAFASAWDAALDQGTQVLIDTAYERAMNGVTERLYDADGNLTATRVRPDSATLRWIIARRSPYRFGYARRSQHDAEVEQEAVDARYGFPAHLAGLIRRDARMRAHVEASTLSTSEAVEAGLISPHASGFTDAETARRALRPGYEAGRKEREDLRIWREVEDGFTRMAEEVAEFDRNRKKQERIEGVRNRLLAEIRQMHEDDKALSREREDARRAIWGLPPLSGEAEWHAMADRWDEPGETRPELYDWTEEELDEGRLADDESEPDPAVVARIAAVRAACDRRRAELAAGEALQNASEADSGEAGDPDTPPQPWRPPPRPGGPRVRHL